MPALPQIARTTDSAAGSWLWSARADLAVFVGSAATALLLSFAAQRAGIREVSDGCWLLLVLGVDVAHVHATWFRTYFDGAELRRHPWRYILVPVALYAAGWFAYHAGPLPFWRALAYAAVFHFVRQQAGWMALYRARERMAGSLDGTWAERGVDDAAIYAATLYPLLEWHVHAHQHTFAWFVPGDFVALPLDAALPFARAAWLLALAALIGREAVRWLRVRRVALGRSLVALMTALTWYYGIVASDSDFVFTATNVIPHGVPYVWLLYRYSRERGREAPTLALGAVATAGLFAFVLVLIGCAYVEELAWDRFVDHDRSWLFGEGSELPNAVLAWLVPFLALPQATHYVLDGVLWRRSESRERPAQRAAVGLAAEPALARREFAVQASALEGGELG